MRLIVLFATMFAASAPPALAQVYPDPGLSPGAAALRDVDLFSRQQAAQQRSVELENRLSNLEAQAQTQANLRQLQSQQGRHAQPGVVPPPGRAPSPGSYASIPDDRLAASNARVKAASGNRR